MNEAQLGYCVRIEVYTRTAYKDSLSSQLQRKPLLIKGSGNIFQALCTCILFVMRFINCFGHTSICESIKIKDTNDNIGSILHAWITDYPSLQ